MRQTLRRLEAAAVFLTSFGLAALVVRNKNLVETFLRHIGPFIAYPLAVLIFTVVASAPFSVTDALAIMNGVIFGPVYGSLVNAVGLVFAALAGYGIALRTSHLLELDKNIERLPGWVRRFRVGSPAFLITLRIIPGLGGTLATQIAAAMRINIWVHVWTMCAIAVPICTLLAIFGDRLSAFIHEYMQPEKYHHMTEHVTHFFHHLPPTPMPS